MIPKAPIQARTYLQSRAMISDCELSLTPDTSHLAAAVLSSKHSPLTRPDTTARQLLAELLIEKLSTKHLQPVQSEQRGDLCNSDGINDTLISTDRGTSKTLLKVANKR